MVPIETLFADYASYHRTRGNKWFHRFGIPMIQLTLIGMLARVDLVRLDRWQIDVAVIVIAAATIYYVAIEWRLGIAMLFISVGMYYLGAAMPLWLNVAGFILGWILQFLGHSVYEKRQPAFFRNFVHLLVGPLWILNDLLPVVKPTQSPSH